MQGLFFTTLGSLKSLTTARLAIEKHLIVKQCKHSFLLMLLLLMIGKVSIAQSTIFSENFGTPSGTTNISTYSTGTAPATFQNKSTLTFGIGGQTTSDVRTTNASSGYTGSSGNGNVFFATSGTIGLSIEGINASGYTSMTLSYGYRKENASAHATFSVDYWDGSAWQNLANTASNLFNEAANAATGWYLAKTLTIPVGGQINGLKIRFVKSGSNSIRIDDVVLKGTAPTSPTLTAAIGATVDNNFDITFTDNATWRSNITTVKYGSNTLTNNVDYTISSGKLTLIPSGSAGSGLRLAGSNTVTISATGSGYPDATVSQAIGYGAATKLAINTQPAAPASNGAALATQPIITVLDQYNNTVANSTLAVGAAVGSGTWTLGGTTNVNAVNGVATFTNLSATSAAAVTGATINFTATNVTGITSNAFNISAPATGVLNAQTLSTALTGTYGSAGTSSSFTASGTGLTSSITVTAQSGFEVSTDNTTFLSSVLVASGTTVYIRTSATKSAGTFNNTTLAQLTSGTATSVNITSSNTGNSVAQKQLTVSGAVAQSKAYDGTTTATITGATLVGVVSGDNVSVSGNGAFADANVGTGISVTPNLSLSGTNASNYSLQQPTGLFASITKASQTISFPYLSSRLTGSGSFNLTASASSGLSISYTSSNTSVATVSGNTVTIVGVGSTVITATQAGNSNYNAASAVTRTLTIIPNTATSLGAGDIAVIAYNTNGSPDNFAILVNKDLGPGTTFFINDNEITTAGDASFTDLAEGEASFTVNAGQIIPAGTVIVLPWGGNAVSTTTYNYSSTSGFGLGNNNEEIYIYTAADITSQTATQFIYGVKIGSSTSAIPAGLTSGTTFIAPSGGALRYNATGALYVDCFSNILAAIGNTSSNWSTTNATTFAESDWSFSITNAIIATSGTLSALTTTYGTASSATSFVVSGINMQAGITITPPAGFEVAASSDFSTTIGSNSSPLVVGSAGAINSTTIYLRLASTTNPGTYSGNITLSSGCAYSVSVSTVNSTVSTKALTIDGLTGNNKTYDGGVSATFSGTPTLSGVINGDVVSIAGTATANFSSANANNNVSITVSGYSLSGANASKYTLTQPTLSANIAQKELTISGLDANDKVENGNTTATLTGTATLVGVISSDNSNVTLGGTPIANFIDANVGTNKVVIVSGYSISGSKASNYFLTQPNYITANIISASLLNQTITFDAFTTPRVYGDASFNLTASSTSGLSVTFTSSNPSVATISGNTVTIVGAGTTTISANQTGNGTYNAAPIVSRTLTVNTKTLTITGLSGVGKIYDATTTATLTGTAVLNGIVNSDVINLGGSVIANFSDANVGTNKTITVSGYTISGSKSSSYSLQQPSGLVATISKASQIITFPTIPSKLLTDAAFSAGASVNTGLTLTYSSSNTSVATINSSGTITLVGIGQTTITVTQAGNSNYNSATSSQTFSVENPTTLSAGDIAIIAFGPTTTDKFAFVLMRDIAKGTVINFTDNGFSSATAGRTGEGYLTYTAQASQCAGTVITWSNGMTITGTGWSSSNPTSFAFNSSGDQLFAFQGNSGDGVSTPTTVFGASGTGAVPAASNTAWIAQTGITLICGIQSFSTWTTSAASASLSFKPTAISEIYLLDFGTTSKSDVYYTSTTTTNTRSNLWSIFGTVSNYTTSSIAITLPNYTSFGIANNNISSVQLTSTTCSSGAYTNVITLSSSSLTSGIYTVNYTLSGATSLSSANATMNFSAGVGTINVVTNAGTTSLTINSLLLSTNTCSQILSSGNTLSIYNAQGFWVGSNGASANTASNWCSNTIPTSTVDVVINNTTPKLTNNLSVNSLNLNSGLDLNGYSLIITGNLTGTGTLKGNPTSNLTLNGTGTIYIDQTNPVSWTSSNLVGKTNVLNNLDVSGGTVTLADSLQLLGTLTKTTGDLTINRKLTLKSTATTQAIVAQINSGTISGNITVERYIAKGLRAFRDLTPGVSGAGSIYSNWQEGGSFLSGFGTYVTGFAESKTFNEAKNAIGFVDATTGLDKTTSGSKSLYTYNNNNGTWNPALSNSKDSALTEMKGYRILVRGDRNWSMYLVPQSTNMITATTLRTTGTLLTGTQTVSGLNTKANGFSMVGNPYVAPIDWLSIDSATSRQNINPTIWILSPKTRTYITVGTAGIVTPSAGGHNIDRYIQPGQAFFVQTSAAGAASLTFRETNKVTSSNVKDVFGATDNNILRLGLYKPVSSVTLDMVDEAVAVFGTAYSNVVNSDDSYKFENPSDNIMLVNGQNDLAIEARQVPTDTDVVNVGLKKLDAGINYQIRIDATQFTSANGMNAYLKDAYTKTEKLIQTGVTTVVDFTVDNTIASTYSNRFTVIFKPTVLPLTSVVLSGAEKDGAVALQLQTVGEQGIVRYEVERSSNGSSFTTINAIAAKNTATASYNVIDAQPLSGNNYYRVKVIGTNEAATYSNITLVKVGVGGYKFSVVPNPAKRGQAVMLQVGQLPSGTYTVSVRNVLGQSVHTQTVQHNGMSALRVPLTFSSPLAAGTYNVQIGNAGKSTFNTNWIVE